MTKKSKATSDAAKKVVRPGRRGHDGIVVPYPVFAVAEDGTRQSVDAHRLVIGVASDEIEIDLTVPHVALTGQVRIATRGKRALVIGPGDASSVYVRTVPFGDSRRKQR
jgi:hypothetical protein